MCLQHHHLFTDFYEELLREEYRLADRDKAASTPLAAQPSQQPAEKLVAVIPSSRQARAPKTAATIKFGDFYGAAGDNPLDNNSCTVTCASLYSKFITPLRPGLPPLVDVYLHQGSRWIVKPGADTSKELQKAYALFGNHLKYARKVWAHINKKRSLLPTSHLQCSRFDSCQFFNASLPHLVSKTVLIRCNPSTA